MSYNGQVLKSGDDNLTVAMLQSRLRELGYFPKSAKSTGFYGETTRLSVVSFQKENFPVPKGFSLVRARVWKSRHWDGIVGPMTWQALWVTPNLKISKTDSFISNVSSKLYKKPRAGWTMTELERKEVYGFTKEKVKEHLVKTTFLGKKVYIHSLHEAQLANVEKRIKKYEAKHKLKEYKPKQVSSFNWRLIRGGLNLSNHSFGIAIDLDWKYNPMTADYNEIKKWNSSDKKIPQYVIDAFLKEGARWGGQYRGRKDYMHFEF